MPAMLSGTVAELLCDYPHFACWLKTNFPPSSDRRTKRNFRLHNSPPKEDGHTLFHHRVGAGLQLSLSLSSTSWYLSMIEWQLSPSRLLGKRSLSFLSYRKTSRTTFSRRHEGHSLITHSWGRLKMNFNENLNRGDSFQAISIHWDGSSLLE